MASKWFHHCVPRRQNTKLSNCRLLTITLNDFNKNTIIRKDVGSLTLVANLNELSDSPKHSSLGDTLTNISVLLLPPSEFCSKYVNLEFRYGMCFSCDVSTCGELIDGYQTF